MIQGACECPLEICPKPFRFTWVHKYKSYASQIITVRMNNSSPEAAQPFSTRASHM
jgi:hypothetical protein